MAPPANENTKRNAAGRLDGEWKTKKRRPRGDQNDEKTRRRIDVVLDSGQQRRGFASSVDVWSARMRGRSARVSNEWKEINKRPKESKKKADEPPAARPMNVVHAIRRPKTIRANSSGHETQREFRASFGQPVLGLFFSFCECPTDFVRFLGTRFVAPAGRHVRGSLDEQRKTDGSVRVLQTSFFPRSIRRPFTRAQILRIPTEKRQECASTSSIRIRERRVRNERLSTAKSGAKDGRMIKLDGEHSLNFWVRRTLVQTSERGQTAGGNTVGMSAADVTCRRPCGRADRLSITGGRVQRTKKDVIHAATNEPKEIATQSN